jgi:hypothetical protein
MNKLKEIENQYGFQYPALYKKMYETGFLDWKTPAKNWFTEVYPGLKSNPPFLLYTNDFEILDIERIIDDIAFLKSPDYYQKINPAYTFIPFAKNRAGDFYCFMPTANESTEIPIVFVWHDDDEATIKAKNIGDFIFRTLLEAVVDIWEDSLIMDGDFKENIFSMLNSHKHTLTSKRYTIIEGVYNKELVNFTDGTQKNEETGLLSYEELAEILDSEIAFDNLNHTFQYTLPEEPFVETEENKRRVGTLMLKVTPKDNISNELMQHIKALNWRQAKEETNTNLTFLRKGSVIFGVPSMDTVDDTFREKLMNIKTKFDSVALFFEDNETNQVYPL